MKKILVVDDNLEFADLLKLALSVQYDVTSCSTMSQVQALDDSAHWDLLIIDFHVGPYNLPDVLAEINYACPVILMTGSAKIDQSKLQQVRTVLEKPFKMKELENLIERTLNEPGL